MPGILKTPYTSPTKEVSLIMSIQRDVIWKTSRGGEGKCSCLTRRQHNWNSPLERTVISHGNTL